MSSYLDDADVQGYKLIIVSTYSIVCIHPTVELNFASKRGWSYFRKHVCYAGERTVHAWIA